MTITALSLTNPGAESGDTTGWTVRSGTAPFFADSANFPHSGSWHFNVNTNQSFTTFTCDYDQEIDVSASATAIDADLAAVDAYGWVKTSGFGIAHLYVQFLDSGHTAISTVAGSDFATGTYTQSNIRTAVPVNTRFVRIGTHNAKTNNANSHTFWDDFSIDFSDDREADYPGQFAVHAFQLVAYAFATQPAAEARLSQAVVQVMSAGETATGLPVKLHQVVAYAWVKGKVDRVDLRAWTILQDDHLFYGLQLGNIGTIVHDVSTGQWTQWQSPGFAYFRVEDAVDWEGFNLGCDTENGTIWKFDPTGRLDNGDTAINSIVTGMATVRFRRAVPCYMAELSVSEAHPSSDGTSIQLLTSDDATETFYDHGTIDAEAAGTETLFRWFGLGLMQAPGRVFRILNNGYARRVDGLDIEVGSA